MADANKNRREFMRLLGMGAIPLALINPYHVISKTYNNKDVKSVLIEPTTALAVANLGLKVAGLFNGGGSIDGITIELLQNISKQLNNISDQIKIVIKRLDEINEQLEKLPKRVVTELQDRIIYSKLVEYSSLISLYEEYRRKKKLEEKFYGDPRVVKRINNAIDSVRESRQILSTYNETYLNIPTMALAIHLEFNLMDLARYPTEQKKIEMDSYHYFFSKILHSSEDNLLSQIEKEREKRQELNTQWKYEDSYVHIIKPSQVAFEHYRWQYRLISTVDPEIEQLYSLGLIEDYEKIYLPQEVEWSFKFDEKYIARMQWMCQRGESGACDAIDKADEKEREIYNKVVASQINLYNRYTPDKLYYMVSLYYTGNRTLNFIQNWTNANS